MRKPVLGTNVAIFVIFFGLALLDSIRFHNWALAAFWLAIALFFLGADVVKWRRDTNT